MPRLVLLVMIASSARAAAPPGLLEVEVARPIFRTVMKQKTYEARIEPRETLQVRARVSGPITRAAVREGDKVKKGDVLFEIDARPARIRLAKTEALLKRAHARLKKAKDDEEIRAEADAAHADVDEAKLTVESATVRSPLDGRVRKRSADVGTVVRADDTVMAVIDSTGPVHVVFDVEEADYVENFRLIRLGKAPAGKKAAEVVVRISETDSRAGKVVVVGSHLADVKDWQGRTVRAAAVRAEVPDPDDTLAPGMLSSVTAWTSAPFKAAFLPRVRDGEVQVAKASGQIERRRVYALNTVAPITLRFAGKDRTMYPYEGVGVGDWVVRGWVTSDGQRLLGEESDLFPTFSILPAGATEQPAPPVIVVPRRAVLAPKD